MKAVEQKIEAPIFAQKNWVGSLIRKLVPISRIFIAVAMVAFGVQQFVYLDFVTRVFPKMPGWIPAHSILACIFGAFLITVGVAIIIGKGPRLAALLLGAVILVSFAILYLPLLITTPPNGGLWTNAGKALALAGGCFLVAGSLPVKADSPATFDGIRNFLESFIPVGRFFLAGFLILGGIEHFIYVQFVAGLVPAWIPGHIFWTYFAGVALIAGGVGICIDMTSWLAAILSGLMIFLWVILLHIPRAAADLHNANETTAVFEALAMSGAAFLVAATQRSRFRD